MTCRHCHTVIGQHDSWFQAHIGRRVVDACSIGCLAEVLGVKS